MKEMRADLYGPPRYMGVENSIRTIALMIDRRWDDITQNPERADLEISNRVRHWSDGVADERDYLENWASQIPNEEARRVLLGRIAAIRDDRPKRLSPRRPEWLWFLVTTAIAQWKHNTGKFPITTDNAVLRATREVASPLFKTLRDMLFEMSPKDAQLLTPHLFLSAIKDARKGAQYTVLGEKPPSSRERGRKRKKQSGA
jgi:hypothetical protein